jgi:hypothetical protein
MWQRERVPISPAYLTSGGTRRTGLPAWSPRFWLVAQRLLTCPLRTVHGVLPTGCPERPSREAAKGGRRSPETEIATDIDDITLGSLKFHSRSGWNGPALRLLQSTHSVPTASTASAVGSAPEPSMLVAVPLSLFGCDRGSGADSSGHADWRRDPQSERSFCRATRRNAGGNRRGHGRTS